MKFRILLVSAFLVSSGARAIAEVRSPSCFENILPTEVISEGGIGMTFIDPLMLTLEECVQRNSSSIFFVGINRVFPETAA